MPFFTVSDQTENTEQARINIDTLTAMLIDQKSGKQAIIKEGVARMVDVDRASYIVQNYLVDISQEIASPGIELPEGFKMRALIKA